MITCYKIQLFFFSFLISFQLLKAAYPLQPGSAGDMLYTPDQKAELNMKMDTLLTQYNIPGVAFAIVSKDSVIYMEGLGYSDWKAKTSVNINTHFRVGSISKTFVAMGILKLVEAGQIALHTPVKHILPEIHINNPWTASDPVRIVHLLEHTAGLNDPHFNDYYLDGDPDRPLTEVLKVSRNYLKLRWKPGAYRSYSSAGYMLAGMIIEQISGKRFEDFLKKEVLQPMGMSSSSFILNTVNKKRLARGYKADYQPSQFWHTYSRPAGSLISSVREMAKMIQFMLRKGQPGGKHILAEASIDRMEMAITDPAVKAGLESRVGLGLGIHRYKGLTWYTHYGSIMGFCAAFGYCRDIDVGCVLLTNRWDVDFERGIIRLWNTLRDHAIAPFHYTRPEVSEPVIPDTILKKYTGYYRWCNPPQQLSAWIDLILNYQRIKLENQRLYTRELYFGSWEPLIPVSDNTFREAEEKQASSVFIKTSNNQYAWINNGSFSQKTGWFMPWIHGIWFFLSFTIMLSSVFYSLFWIPLHLYKYLTGNANRCRYLRMRVTPLLAVLIILVSFTLVGLQVNQSLAYIGQKTAINILFYISSLLFAVLSFSSLFFTLRSFKKPVKSAERLYALVLSISCVGLTLYWGYWGIIGLKLWSY